MGVLRPFLVVLEDQEVPRANLKCPDQILHTKYVFNPLKSSLQPIFEMNLRETKREPRKPKHHRFYETDWRELDEVQCKNTCTGQMKSWVQSSHHNFFSKDNNGRPQCFYYQRFLRYKIKTVWWFHLSGFYQNV